MATYTVDKIEYNGNVYVLQDSGALQLTGGSVTGPVTFGDTITVDDATLGTLVVNGNASFTNNIQANTINGVTVGSSPKFTDTNTEVSTLTLAAGSTAGTALSHGGKYTLTAGTKTVSFTMPSAPSVPTSAASATTGITASTTATKTTLGTAFSIPNVTSAGSASTWTFEKKTIPNVTSAGSASTWAFSSVTVANSISGTVNSSDNTQLDITLGTTSVQSKSSGSNGTAPTLGTAIEVYSKSGGGNGSAPTLGTAFSVPNVTGNTSATVSITDNGHTHTLS